MWWKGDFTLELREMFGFLINFLSRVFENRRKRSEERYLRTAIDDFKKEYKVAFIFAFSYIEYADFCDKFEAAYDQLKGLKLT